MSWNEVDLAPACRGGQQSEPPTAFERNGGEKFLYPGRINGLYGESESGKSWLALVACVQEMNAGNEVVYFDYEDTRETAVERLRLLGMESDAIESQFLYFNPTEPFDEYAASAVEKELTCEKVPRGKTQVTRSPGHRRGRRRH